MADKLPVQLQSYALLAQSFMTRFFDHIDPESGPVKRKYPTLASIVATSRLTVSRRWRHCFQSHFLELCCSIRYASFPPRRVEKDVDGRVE